MFDAAFNLLMINEGGNRPDGGLVSNPADTGGTTKFGISQSAYPSINVADLTIDEAKAIYLKDYWNQFFLCNMPWAVAWVLFDCIVNHGAHEPIIWLQNAIGVPADGIMGKGTMGALMKVKNPLNVARDLTLARRDYVETLRNYDTFKQGWCRRHLDTLIGAVVEPAEED